MSGNLSIGDMKGKGSLLNMEQQRATSYKGFALKLIRVSVNDKCILEYPGVEMLFMSEMLFEC